MNLLKRQIIQGWSNDPWAPVQAPGLSLWLDASLASTLTLDTAAVAAWADRSAGNHGVSQATVAAQLAWSATAGGTSLPGVTFDGTDDFLSHPAAWLYAAGAATVAIVATYPSPATTRYIVSEGITASTTQEYGIVRTNPSVAASGVSRIITDAGATVLSNVPTAGSSWQSVPQVLLRVDTGANVAAYRNGTLGNNSSYTRATTTLDTFALGARARATPDNFAAVTLHEVLAWSRALEAAEVDQVNGYLAWRWGQQANLPSNHPYKLAAP